MSEEKFVGYFRLIEACAEPGCPVCRCVAGESHGYLDSLLYEQVTDPDTRRALRASWGFCNWHVWMLLDVRHAIFGASIIYEDVVRRALKETERLADGVGAGHARGGWLAALLGQAPRSGVTLDGYDGRAACPACTHAAATERRYLDTLVAFVEDGDLKAAYARSAGICLPHLLMAVEHHGGRAEARSLVQRTREKWAGIATDLGSFVSKHDYRNREPYTPAEVESYTRAFEMLAGARGIFGNDLHRRVSGTTEDVRPSAADGRSVTPGGVRENAS